MKLSAKIFKSKLLWLICLLVLGGGIYKISVKKEDKPQDDTTGLIKRGDLVQRVTITGTVMPNRRSTIMAPYKGYIQKLFVKIGDRVNLGDPLASVTESLQSRDPVFPLRAPVSGIVTQIEKVEGEYAKDNDPKDFILRIDDTSKMIVTATVPEIDRMKISPGMEADVKVVPIQDRKYKGVLRDLALAAREPERYGRSTQADFSLRVEIKDPDQRLRPGMSAVMDIITAKRENVLMVRHEYLKKRGEKVFVTLPDKTEREVKLGLQNEEGFEVLEGAKEGERFRIVDFAAILDESNG